jgi:F-type H+-transporting ATPase subunit epsilon
MADTVEFELVSPTRLLVSEPVEMVVVPGEEGDFGALPGHAPFISQVRPGVIDVHGNGEVVQRIFVAGGFAEVTGERCTVLAEEAIPVEDIDAGEARARLEAARSALAAGDDDPRGLAQRRRELRIAEALAAAAGA